MKKLGLGKVRALFPIIPFIEPTFIQLGMRTHTENSLSHTPTSNVRYIALKCDLHVTLKW